MRLHDDAHREWKNIFQLWRENGERLVDSWLLPRPVRRIARSGGAIVVGSWVEGLSSLLATPQGRA